MISIANVKSNYEYKYPFLDCTENKEIEGFIYNVKETQYFIDNKDTYIKIIGK